MSIKRSTEICNRILNDMEHAHALVWHGDRVLTLKLDGRGSRRLERLLQEGLLVLGVYDWRCQRQWLEDDLYGLVD